MAKKKAAPKSDTPARTPQAAVANATVDGVPLTMTIEVGRTRDVIGTIQEYREHSLVELDKTVNEPVDLLLNGQLWARGEVVTVNENFGVRITEVVHRPGD